MAPAACHLPVRTRHSWNLPLQQRQPGTSNACCRNGAVRHTPHTSQGHGIMLGAVVTCCSLQLHACGGSRSVCTFGRQHVESTDAGFLSERMQRGEAVPPPSEVSIEGQRSEVGRTRRPLTGLGCGQQIWQYAGPVQALGLLLAQRPRRCRFRSGRRRPRPSSRRCHRCSQRRCRRHSQR